MERIICLIIGYAFGLFQTSYIYGKARGIDIRTKGSGNAGTTNALRTLGRKAGLITLAGDILKCLAAVLVTWLIFHRTHPDIMKLLGIYTSAGVILGHDYPFYMVPGRKGNCRYRWYDYRVSGLAFDYCGNYLLFCEFFCHSLCIAGFTGAFGGLFHRRGDIGSAGSLWDVSDGAE